MNTTTQLTERQVIYHCSDRGIVSHVEGIPSPETCRRLGGVISMGGRAHIDVVFEERISHHIPESIVYNLPWELTDEIVSPEELANAITAAEQAEADAKAAKITKAEARAIERAALPSRYPTLKPRTSDTSAHAAGARNLRKELKAAFPGVKFSVTCRHSSINVEWADGPTTATVDAIADRYQECSFDGMTDLESYRENDFAEIFGGGRYVFCQRSNTIEGMREAWRRIGCSEAEVIEKTENGRTYWDRWASPQDIGDHMFKAWVDTDLR